MIFVLQPLLSVTTGALVQEQEVLRRKYRVILTQTVHATVTTEYRL